MLCLIICSSFLLIQNKLINNILYCKKHNVYKDHDILDEDYKSNSGICEVKKNDDPEELDRIIKHFINYELLKKLNSSLISMHEKRDIIKKNDIIDLDNYAENIYSGGLLDDWNFNF